MKITLTLKAFLATGWFIKPTCKTYHYLIPDIEKALKQIIIQRKTEVCYDTDMLDVRTHCYDLSTDHNGYLTQLGLDRIRWEDVDYCETLTIGGAPYYLTDMDAKITTKGIVRDLNYLSHQGDGITSIVFLNDFLNVPFFKKELKIFEALGYDIFIYNVDSKTLTKWGDQNGGTTNAQNKITDVSDSDRNDSVTDFIASRKKWANLRDNAIGDDFN